jgi:hypothetical protein
MYCFENRKDSAAAAAAAAAVHFVLGISRSKVKSFKFYDALNGALSKCSSRNCKSDMVRPTMHLTNTWFLWSFALILFRKLYKVKSNVRTYVNCIKRQIFLLQTPYVL